jgi:HlyD family secretion protein
MDFLCSIPVFVSLIGGCPAPQPVATGYVEGEYVLLAPVETGRIETILAKRGDRLNRDQTVVSMEAQDAEIAVNEAVAAIDQARAQLANLKEGRRPEEIAVITAALNSAQAQADEARRVYERQKDLLARGIAPQSDFDGAKTRYDQAKALVEQSSANLEVARLPARPEEIRSAEAQVRQAEARLANARWRFDHRQLKSPADGVVDDVIRRVGEVAGPSQPVLSILPDAGVKIRLYVPEVMLSQLAPGRKLAVRCDGCAEGLTATIFYIADGPEFTPPVIYSLENRQKLVYLIEARPDDPHSTLKPGQIVDAVLSDKPQ